MSRDEVADRIAEIHRAWFGRAVGVLVRTFRDLDLAEESVQDAFATALVRWPRDGIPDEPGAWIVRTAHNRAIDVIRRQRVGVDRERSAVESGRRAGRPAPDELGDERLDLLFGCCHPALAEEARVALTLRIVAGLTVEEIARAYLIAPAAVAQRLVRAKRRVREAGIPLRVPPPELLPERLDGVLGTVYLLYNEGYVATAGPDPMRGELCDEAIRLARLLVRLMPDEPEARGLLALLLCTDARRAARYDGDRLVPLDEHDRSRYDQALLREGQALVGGGAAARARSVRRAGGDRGAALGGADRGGDRLAADRGAVRRAGADGADAGGGAQPRGRDQLRRRSGGRARRCSTSWRATCRASGRCMRRERTCCGAWTARRRRQRRIARRSR